MVWARVKIVIVSSKKENISCELQLINDLSGSSDISTHQLFLVSISMNLAINQFQTKKSIAINLQTLAEFFFSVIREVRVLKKGKGGSASVRYVYTSLKFGKAQLVFDY
jgi:hypothetical protein